MTSQARSSRRPSKDILNTMLEPTPMIKLSSSPTELNINELTRLLQVSTGLLEVDESISLPKSSLSVSLLPVELLREIFIYCLPTEEFLIPSPTHAPLLLGRVSSQWRAVALATPELWSTLHINYRDPIEDPYATSVWLSRSGDRPLSLSLAIDFGEKRHQAILDVLQRHSHRWQHVRFDFRHLYCPPMYMLSTAQNNVPKLRTFEFHARDISSTNFTPITTLLTSAPNLREVTWVDDLADRATLLELPLGRLTRLALAIDRGTLDYLELLNQCSNLEHIRITRPCADVPAPRQPLLLAKLTSLNISQDLTEILDHLVLPALKHVRIHREYTPGLGMGGASSTRWTSAAFIALLKRSACAIENLWLDAPMEESTLIECIQNTSGSLVHLSVVGINIGDAFIDALMPSEAVWPFPCLERLDLDTRVVCGPGALGMMVETRVASSEGHDVKKLRSIRLLDGTQDLDRLRKLREQGQLGLEITPRKEMKTRPRSFFPRRKLSSSR